MKMNMKRRNRTPITNIALWSSLAMLMALSGNTVSANQSEESWDDWQAIGQGYIARRKVPANFDRDVSQRRSDSVDDRLESNLQRRNRVESSSVLSSSGLELTRTSQALSAITTDSLWIKTQGSGLFSVPIADIATVSGYSEAQIIRNASRRRLTITNNDQAVRWMYYPDTASIVFVGEEFGTFYTEQNAYHLLLTRTSDSKRMYISSQRSGPDDGIATPFLDTLKFEEEPDLYFVVGQVVADEPDVDYWFWDFTFGGSRESIDIPLSVPNPASSGTAQIRINLRGATDLAQNEHEMFATMNGQEIGSSITWDGFQAATLVVDFDQDKLNADGGNVLGLHGVYGDTPSIQYLDDIELDYMRMPIAENGMLELNGLQNDTQQLVTGFTSDQVLVIKNPDTNPSARRDITIFEETDGSFSVAFYTKNSNDYLVSQVNSMLSIDVLDEDIGSNLASSSASADYLIIAPRAFSQTAQGLKVKHQGNFASVEIAWLDDIYDEFSAGRVDPFALTRFLDFAQSNWSLSPSMVVILGKGTLDHKDRMGYGDSFVPIVMTDTPWALAASDDRLLGGEEIAGFSIGRIPMISDAQGMAYLDKLSVYEQSLANPERSTAVLVADNPDEAGDFHANSDEVADDLENDYGFSAVVKNYSPQSPTVSAQMLLDSTWEAGLVSYDGHGSTSQVGNGSEDFILASNAINLTNENYPVFAALTCAAGDFSYPGTDSLAESLVLNPNGGAAVAYAPTGLSLDSEAQAMANAFYASLYGGSNRIGTSVLDAKVNTAVSTQTFMRRIYSVVGDPAAYAR